MRIGKMVEPLHLNLEYSLRPEQVFTYIHIPFEVPVNVGRIDVAYHYEHAIISAPGLSDGNTIDIGIFDVRGIHWMSPGFRGWSGGARQSFYIATDSATPGYMPGPIQAGTWHICLGAYQVAPSGCACRITIDLTVSDGYTAEFPEQLLLRTSARRSPNLDGWYKGELHCHT